ncbi:MAG: hypothetical protein ABI475_06910 [Methylophilaceae bacterium]
MNNLITSEEDSPEGWLLYGVKWSFKNHSNPANTSELIQAIAHNHKDMGRDDMTEILMGESPFSKIDIAYEFFEPLNGHAGSAFRMATNDEQKLTYGQILMAIHMELSKALEDKDTDRIYFKGLSPLPNPLEEGVPAYLVEVGSQSGVAAMQ